MEEEGLTERQAMIASLRRANRGILERLASQRIQVDGIAGERHEYFINWLVEIGILDADQMEQFDLLWESQLNDTLQKEEVKYQEAVRKATQEKRTPKLILPPHR